MYCSSFENICAKGSGGWGKNKEGGNKKKIIISVQLISLIWLTSNGKSSKEIWTFFDGKFSDDEEDETDEEEYCWLGELFMLL